MNLGDKPIRARALLLSAGGGCVRAACLAMRSGARLTAIGLALCVAGCATRGSVASRGETTRPAPATTSAPPTNPTAALPLISYCELVHEPVRYLGKKVRVVGVFRVGFEWEELYSTRCPDVY